MAHLTPMGALLPRGTHHSLEGVLVAGGQTGLSLRVDDGGVWRLDCGAKARALLNRRVRVEGIRSGFDMVDVTTIVPIEADTGSIRTEAAKSGSVTSSQT